MRKIIKIVTHISSLVSLAVLVLVSTFLGRVGLGAVSGEGKSKLVLLDTDILSVPHALADAPSSSSGTTTTGDSDTGPSDCDGSTGGDDC